MLLHAVGAAEAGVGYLPLGRTVQAAVGGFGNLQAIKFASGAGAAGIQPVAVSIKAILDMIRVYG